MNIDRNSCVPWSMQLFVTSTHFRSPSKLLTTMANLSILIQTRRVPATSRISLATSSTRTITLVWAWPCRCSESNESSLGNTPTDTEIPLSFGTPSHAAFAGSDPRRYRRCVDIERAKEADSLGQKIAIDNDDFSEHCCVGRNLVRCEVFSTRMEKDFIRWYDHSRRRSHRD